MIQDLIKKHEKRLEILQAEYDSYDADDNALCQIAREEGVIQGFLKDLRELEGNQWISIAETKPPFEKWVTCYCRIHGLFLGRYEQIGNTEFGQWDNGNEKGVLPPTHWMELPDVPTIKR